MQQRATSTANEAAPAQRLCPECGEEEFVEVLELWIEERAFVIETCCEWSHGTACEELRHLDRKGWREFLRASAGIYVRSVVSEPVGTMLLDYGLRFGPVPSRDDLKAFINTHHRHNPAPLGWRWAHALYNGPELIGVATVGRPVARMLDPEQVVEVTRVCVKDCFNSRLAWNACSMFYGAACKEAMRRGFPRIITYTLETETGAALRGAGWEPVKRTKGGSWSRAGRPRQDRAPTCPKIRWERDLRAGRRIPSQVLLWKGMTIAC